MNEAAMNNVRRFTVVLFTLLVTFIVVPVALAHPLGNFTINQYAGLNISRDQILVDYVVDMAEIPAFQEITIFDTNGNGQPESAESAGYHAEKCASLQPGLKLFLNNRPVDFTLASSSVEFPSGVGGLPTLRLTCNFEAPIIANDEFVKLAFINNAFPDRLGWKEIVVTADSVSLEGDYDATSPSHRLTTYPQDLLTSPLDQREVEFEIRFTGSPMSDEAPATAAANESLLVDRNDAFTRLILLDEITLTSLLLALAVSFIWGAMHALTPGHGKTIVGAYLIGSRGTIRHALYLGLATTITHTAGVFALGLVTLFASRFIVPETLYPWMSLLSGLLVVGLGANLLIDRLRSSKVGTWLQTFRAGSVRTPDLRSSAFQHVHVESGAHQHGYVLSSAARVHPHGSVHAHTHDSHHDHDHDHGDHSHVPPGADGSPVTWRSLLGLGISGGLVPCPSALVVLLGAIALNRIGFGLLLVFAFSLGLAGALTAIGLLFIYAGRFFDRFSSSGKIVRILPVFSAVFISLIGFGIALRALTEIRLIGF